MSCKTSTTDRILLSSGGIAALLFCGIATYEMSTRPGFDIRRHAISMLSLGDRGWIMAAAFIGSGVLTLLCAAGLSRVVRGSWLAFLIGIYGGYFTAAQGIMLIATMSALLPEDMHRMNAAKNLLSLLVNIVAALAYTLVAFDRISWEAAALIAVGSLFGGWVGAHYGRRLSPNALRAAIVMVGIIGLYRLVTV